MEKRVLFHCEIAIFLESMADPESPATPFTTPLIETSQGPYFTVKSSILFCRENATKVMVCFHFIVKTKPFLILPQHNFFSLCLYYAIL